MRKHPRSLDFKYGVLSRGSSRVSGSMKGHGYSSELLNYCLEDARQKGYKGVCILSSKGRKKEFLSDYKYLTHKGFKIADESDNGIILMYLPFTEGNPPQFKECAKHPHINEQGFILYRSMSFYRLLGTMHRRSGKRIQHSFKNDSYHNT